MVDAFLLVKIKPDRKMSVSIAYDNTARQIYAHDTVESLSDILDSVPAAIFVLNTQGVIVQQNALARQWINADVVNQPWAWVLEQHFEVSADHQDLRTHDKRIVSLSTSPLKNGKGQTLLLTDVTEQRALQLTQARQSRLALMGEMLATMAHQVRTPLTSSMLYFSQAQSDSIPPQLQKNFVQKGLENLKLLESMIRELLMFSKGGQFNAQWVRLDTALNYCQQQVKPLLSSHQGELNIKHSDCVEVKANHDALASILINLVENALVHNERPVQVNIETRYVSEQLQISIQNNGAAIANKVVTDIYTPFVTTRSNGTGLGLSIVKTIVESFGGSIALSNNEDGNVCFVLQLHARQTGAKQ